MSRAIAILAVLCLSATAFGDVIVDIQNLTLSPTEMTFDLVVVDLQGLTDPVTLFGAGVTLQGPAAVHFAGDANANKRPAGYNPDNVAWGIVTPAGSWRELIELVPGSWSPPPTIVPPTYTGLHYAFGELKDDAGTVGATSSNSAVSTDGNTLQQMLGSEYGSPLEGATLAVGDVLARFIFENVDAYAGPLSAADLGVLLHLEGMSQDGTPENQGKSAHLLLADNTDIPIQLIPEPATMGLLGLGLLGLVIRKKK